MSIGDVREHFIEVGPDKRFFFEPTIVDQASATNAEGQTRPSTAPYTLDRERAMLTVFGRHVLHSLQQRAADVRSRHVLVLAEGAVDWVDEAIGSDRIQAQVCRLLGLMGTSAQVRPDERERLRAKGLPEREINQVDAAVRRHAKVEDERDWLIGPEREVLLFHLDSIGVSPTDANVQRLRAGALCLMADLLERTADRYTAVPIHVGEIAAEVLRQPDHQVAARRAVDTSVLRRRSVASEPTSICQHMGVEEHSTPASAEAEEPSVSFIALVEALARSKTNPKARSWTDKTARQHVSIAKLFVKCAGSDRPTLMSQAHVGAYISLLARLPTHWGKSAADTDRSIDEIMARVEDLDDDEIGLSAPTINRHRTQLSTILAHMDENGFPIGVVSKKSMAKDTRSPDEKRQPFTVEDGRKIIAGSPWTGDDARPHLAHRSLSSTDSQFWVFPIAWYMLMRLGEICGLMVDDIDLHENLILIRHNALRRVKNKTSERTIPIHPELIRLGFVDFVVYQKRLGNIALFPELHGSKTASTVIFNKRWIKRLDEALPDARAKFKTMHSTRKGGNGAMISGKIIDSTRYYIMGHALKDVHGRHYTPRPKVDEMLEAVSHVPLITDRLLTFQGG